MTKITVWDHIDDNARKAARSGAGVSACPYRHDKFSNRWLSVFQREQQIDLLDVCKRKRNNCLHNRKK